MFVPSSSSNLIIRVAAMPRTDKRNCSRQLKTTKKQDCTIVCQLNGNLARGSGRAKEKANHAFD